MKLGKLAISPLLLMTSLHLHSQDISITNAYTGDSTVYVNVRNPFVFKTGRKSVQDVQSSSALVFLKGDSLFIQPNNAGRFNIKFTTTKGSQNYYLTAIYPAPLKAVIVNNNIYNKEISKNEILSYGKIKLLNIAPGQNNKIQITSYVIKVGDTTFSGNGERLSEEAKAQISSLKTGAEIQITSVTAKNVSTQQTINISGNTIYVIK